MNSFVRSLFVAVFVITLGLPSITSPAHGQSDDQNPAKPVDCYSVRGEARYRAVGYNHVVIVVNNCKIPLNCKVWTNVDPEPKMSLSVAAGSTGETTTRIGSPANSFTASGECEAG